MNRIKRFYRRCILSEQAEQSVAMVPLVMLLAVFITLLKLSGVVEK